MIRLCNVNNLQTLIDTTYTVHLCGWTRFCRVNSRAIDDWQMRQSRRACVAVAASMPPVARSPPDIAAPTWQCQLYQPTNTIIYYQRTPLSQSAAQNDLNAIYQPTRPFSESSAYVFFFTPYLDRIVRPLHRI